MLILLLYVALGCLVYCYYEPNIKSLKADVESQKADVEMEASLLDKQDRWNSAITEIEDECRRLGASQSNELARQKRQKERLQQAVENESVRLSHLRKSLRMDDKFRSSVEWRLKTEERLTRAQRALAEFDGPKKDAKVEAKIQKLRQQLEALQVQALQFQKRLEALRVQKQVKLDRLNLMVEWRDRLKIWPLPMIDRFVDEEEPPEEN